MLQIKNPIFVFFDENRNSKDSPDFWHRKMTFKNQNCTIVDLQYLFLLLILQSKLSYAQLFKWGPSISYDSVLEYQGFGNSRQSTDFSTK